METNLSTKLLGNDGNVHRGFRIYIYTFSPRTDLHTVRNPEIPQKDPEGDITIVKT